MKENNIMEKDQAWDLFVGNSHGKRALEVALAGNHSITAVGNPKNGEDLLKVVMGGQIQFICSCLCGNYGSSAFTCVCTKSKIINYHKTKKYQKAMCSEIIVEVVNPRSDDYVRKEESFKKVFERINKVKDNIITKEKIHIDGMSILKLAIDKLGFAMSEVRQVKSVAFTIAKLSGEVVVQAEHIAEAVQYKTVGRN